VRRGQSRLTLPSTCIVSVAFIPARPEPVQGATQHLADCAVLPIFPLVQQRYPVADPPRHTITPANMGVVDDATGVSGEAVPLLIKDSSGGSRYSAGESVVDDEFHFSGGDTDVGPRSSVCSSVFNLTNTSERVHPRAWSMLRCRGTSLGLPGIHATDRHTATRANTSAPAHTHTTHTHTPNVHYWAKQHTPAHSHVR